MKPQTFEEYMDKRYPKWRDWPESAITMNREDWIAAHENAALVAAAIGKNDCAELIREQGGSEMKQCANILHPLAQTGGHDCPICLRDETIATLSARVAELTEQRDNALSEAKESDGVAHAWGVQNKALTARVAELEAAIEGAPVVAAFVCSMVGGRPQQPYLTESDATHVKRIREMQKGEGSVTELIARPTVEVR